MFDLLWCLWSTFSESTDVLLLQSPTKRAWPCYRLPHAVATDTDPPTHSRDRHPAVDNQSDQFVFACSWNCSVFQSFPGPTPSTSWSPSELPRLQRFRCTQALDVHGLWPRQAVASRDPCISRGFHPPTQLGAVLACEPASLVRRGNTVGKLWWGSERERSGWPWRRQGRVGAEGCAEATVPVNASNVFRQWLVRVCLLKDVWQGTDSRKQVSSLKSWAILTPPSQGSHRSRSAGSRPPSATCSGSWSRSCPHLATLACWPPPTFWPTSVESVWDSQKQL